MSKNLFIDANIILDIFDNKRINYKYSFAFYNYVVDNQYNLFTSCDIITTLYYIESNQNKKDAIFKIKDINKTLKVIEFSNKEVDKTCDLIIEDSDYTDLEDTIQYILAKKLKCDMIVTNDKNFISKDIPIINSKNFCSEYNIKEMV